MNNRTLFNFAGGPVATAALGLVTVPAIARRFSPEDVGRLNMIQIVVSFSVLLLSLGLDQSYVREYYESHNTAGLFKSCFMPGLALFAIIALPCLLVSTQLSKVLFGLGGAKYFWLTLGCILATYLSRFLSLILRMRERGLAFSLGQIVPKTAFLLLAAGVIPFYSVQGFAFLEISFLVAAISAVVIYGCTTAREWANTSTASHDMGQMRLLLKYGTPLIFSGLAYWGLAATSSLALRYLSSFSEMGIYSVAMSFAGIALVIQLVFSVVWAPVVYQWAANGTAAAQLDRVSRLALAIVAVVFPICGIFSWLIDYALPEQYQDVKYLVLCSIAQPLLYTLSEVTSVGINITRRTSYSVWSTLTALAANVALNWMLVPRFGASGAVIANAVAYLVFFVARTESSAFVWQRFPCSKLYATTSIALALSVGSVVVGPLVGRSISFFWLALLPVVCLLFRREWREIHLVVVGRIRSQSAHVAN